MDGTLDLLVVDMAEPPAKRARAAAAATGTALDQLRAAATVGDAAAIRRLHPTVDLAAALTARGSNAAHLAAANGHPDCLRVLHELGAGASLSAADINGRTPAHEAARGGKADCLRVVHSCLAEDLGPVLQELERVSSLSWARRARAELLMDVRLGTFVPPLALQRECEPSWNEKWK